MQTPNHTHCCTRTLQELQLQLEWNVIKPPKEIHGPQTPTGIPSKGPDPGSREPPPPGLPHQLLTRGPVVPKEFHLQCLPRLLSKSQGCGSLWVP